jgi:organic hydroperoxide reductase OsmC/OhrA
VAGPISEAAIVALHEKAHAACFIANSVKSEVRVAPVFTPVSA